MRSTRLMMLVPAALLAAACGRSPAPASDALASDLALATQAQPYMPQQFVGPNELGYGQGYGSPYGPQYGQPQYGYPQQYQTMQRAPVYSPAPVRRTSTARRSSSSSSGSRVIYTQPAEPVRHTKRDAAIGAAAGAVLGASTSRDKIKGGIIGAAAGGILGAIVGHTVDVQQP